MIFAMRQFFFKLFLPLLLAPINLGAQAPPQIPPNVAAQIVMLPQPQVDPSQFETVSATAEFDPPVVQPGEKTIYRVAVNATQNSIAWPDEIFAPPELRPGPAARGQLTQPDGTPFHPLTEFYYEFTAATAGRFTISNFVISASGSSVMVPEASVDVAADAATEPARKLLLEFSERNLFFGQPFRVRVILPTAQGNRLEALRDVQFNGGGFLTDRFVTRQSVEVVNLDGQLKPAFIYETVATPLAAGSLMISVQAFTAGNQSGGPPKYVLLVSDPLKINVRPLPTETELPGYTGAIGKFFADPPQLSTNRLRVGEPAHLKIIFHGEGDLTRFVPPMLPRAHDWQIIADNPPATGYTLIPLTDEARETPAIPFSYFDPAAGKYFDLTIPPLPVTVVGEGLPEQLPTDDDESESGAPLKLSGLAPTPGKTVASLKPSQLCDWLVILQFVPAMGFFALWRWDCRRRFLEAHPEIVRRRQARRALRGEKKKLQQAVKAGDAAGFVLHAANALKISCAPHLPAHPQAMVCADVLAQLDHAEQNGHTGETVRKIFAAADAQFASAKTETADLLVLKPAVKALLAKMEEKL